MPTLVTKCPSCPPSKPQRLTVGTTCDGTLAPNFRRRLPSAPSNREAEPSEAPPARRGRWPAVTEPKNRLGKVKAHEFLRQNAADLRRLCGGLLEHGFRLDEEINLSADSGLGSDYESSTIAYKLYEVDAVPDDEDLLDDLEAVLRAYDRYLADAKWREVVDLCRTMLSDRAELDEEIQYKLKIVEQTPADHRRRQYCATKRRRPRPPTALGRRQANTPPPVELIRGYHPCTVRFRLCCTQGLGHLYQLSSERIAPNAPRSLA